MDRYRVLIADDHPDARQAILEMLEDDPIFRLLAKQRMVKKPFN